MSMPSRIISIVGNKYGKLTVVSYAGTRGTRNYWECLCDCGGRCVVEKGHLRSGHTTSCGCASSRATIGTRSLKHGSCNTSEYIAWSNMKQRCSDPNYKEFHLYGGRGIKVCDRWIGSFTNFFEDMGKTPIGSEIDRINNDGHYSPENCRWTTAKVNCRNRRTTRFITHNGETLSVEDWAEKVGVSGSVIRQRLDRQKWSVEKTLYTPVNLPHYLHFQHSKKG